MKREIRLKILAVITIIMMILSIASVVKAATYSVGVNMTADKNLVAGNQITVTVNIKDLVVGSGIDAFMGTVNYDTNVFETLTSDDFVATNGWSPVFNPTTNIFTLLNNSKVSTASSILSIKLTVKSSITATSTDVKLTDMSASGGAEIDGGTGDISISTTTLTISAPVTQPTLTVTKSYDATANTVTVTVKADRAMTNSKVASGWTLSSDGLTYTKVFNQNVNYDTTFDFVDGSTGTKTIAVTEIVSSTNNTTNNTTNTNTNINTNTNSNTTANTSTNSNTNKNDTTTSKSTLPHTGTVINIILGIAIMAVAAVGVISYKKYRNLNF